ncbi:MAG: NAD(P)-dependent oxidoreductase [Bacteroidota bacterium]
MTTTIKSILVLGGTGRTGQHIIEQALKHGLRVTALARNPDKLNKWADNANLEILKGDVSRFPDVYNAVQGNDAIVSALGRDGRNLDAITKGTENIITAVQKSEIKKTICLSSFGAGSTHPYSDWILKLIVHLSGLSSAFQAKAHQELLLYKSKINFTLVMAGTLADQTHANGCFAYSTNNLPHINGLPDKIDRVAVAKFMLEQLDSTHWVRNTVCLLAER